MNYIFKLGTIPEDKKPLSGGKALSLDLMLRNLRVNVPSGYVIVCNSYKDGELISEAEEELKSLIGRLDKNCTYAVRSSAINEDGSEASFAGQYETVTDVKASDIEAAVKDVIKSADNLRVKNYSDSFEKEDKGIAVVIQRFVKPEFAGVIFTSDPITGSDDKLMGNFVRGEGEKLVSGSSDASEFRISTIKKGYEGDEALRRYAKTLRKYCMAIRYCYKMPVDIEWAISEGKVYILQARPITTLRRADKDSYRINGSMSGCKLLTRTNVGEIFQKPVSPMTNSVLEMINDILGLPDWLDNVCGQPYMNISVMCSAFVAFGKTEEAAYAALKDLVGNVPEGTKVPVSPFDKKAFLRNIKTLLFPKEKSKLTKAQKHEMVEKLADISRMHIDVIRGIQSSSDLISYWENTMLPSVKDGFASIASECGTSMVPLFSTRGKIAKIAGSDMANRLCGGCVGVIDSIKPLLLIEDVINGRISREEYIKTCGHRSADEMELMAPRPYEDPSFPDALLEEYKNSSIDLHGMQAKEKAKFEEALAEFKSSYPSKAKWIDKELARFIHANDFREEIRGKGVFIFSVFREFILKAGELTGLGDGIFFLYCNEMFDLLKGDKSSIKHIEERRASYNEYLKYPPFPNIILGRFEPDAWLNEEGRRSDFYSSDSKEDYTSLSSDVKGFPGASGRISGTVRVINDIKDIDSIQSGDILVTVATNIGWTLVFPKVSAIVTDIGAPLSHAAIVAREFGIPAVVGCGNATTLLKTGDKVLVDGSKGTVTKI